ncbi:MAG: Flp family type IVb pilin [Candidatus Dormibacteria bacterium]|jgi:pilus assembly protein Flp/PilA
MARLVSTYSQLREAARRHLERVLSGGQEGQGMVEYGLILVLIAVVVVLILGTIGSRINDVFSNVSNGLAT